MKLITKQYATACLRARLGRIGALPSRALFFDSIGVSDPAAFQAVSFDVAHALSAAHSVPCGDFLDTGLCRMAPSC
jgi:hypothetical protein